MRPALQNLTFRIDPGQRIAVVGRTGAGKSSLYQLLNGFRTTSKGSVLIDDLDISKISLSSLRSEINMVLQQPFVLSSDTIRANLDPKLLFSDKELEKALQDAAFYRFSKVFKEQNAPEDTNIQEEIESQDSYRPVMRHSNLIEKQNDFNLDSLANDLSYG